MKHGQPLFRFGLTLGVLLAIVSATQAQELRTWTNANGTYTLEAKFVSEADGKVILTKEDGGKVTIALEQLSQADQEYIAGLQSANPFKPMEDNPFEPLDEQPSKAVESEPDVKPSARQPRIVTVQWGRSRGVPLISGDRDWSVTVPTIEPAKMHTLPVMLPPETDFFEKFSGMAINISAGKAVVGYTLEGTHRSSPRPRGAGLGASNRRDEASITRLVMCDLDKGRHGASITEVGEMAPLALHNDGQRVLLRQDGFGTGNSQRLEIWSVEKNRVDRLLIWHPYEHLGRMDCDVAWAEFIDGDTLATCSEGGLIAFWNCATAQPICHLQLSRGAVPALSADHQMMAFCSDDCMGVFDVARKRVIALQETPSRLSSPEVSFSPSGKRIACIARDRILVWDTASGRLEKDFTISGLAMLGAIDYPDEDYILLGHKYLVALDSQIKLWEYQGVNYARTAGGVTFLGASEDHRNSPDILMTVRLPHQEALTLLKQALEQPDLFVFHKGSTVRLDVNGVPQSHRAKVAEALTKKLQEMNCKVSSNGAIDLVASVEGPKSERIEYHHAGEYQVNRYTTLLKFVYQGQVAWQTSGTNIPGIVSVGEGENIGDILRRASQQPDYTFYEHVRLPEFLQKPTDNKSGRSSGMTLGASKPPMRGRR
ncbi:MAG: hypothetical protein JW709_03800 [Sedimentisphaerales bacterium]|nr:hypothetical protein [Sedimentisphaerales bacterium]